MYFKDRGEIISSHINSNRRNSELRTQFARFYIMPIRVQTILIQCKVACSLHRKLILYSKQVLLSISMFRPLDISTGFFFCVKYNQHNRPNYEKVQSRLLMNSCRKHDTSAFNQFRKLQQALTLYEHIVIPFLFLQRA